jgi:Ca2+-binding EF-hand superfamily protein
MIDEDNSGIVTRDELVEMFFKYMGHAVTDIELDRMLSIVDADMSGEIGFTEFLIACLDPREVVNTDHLRALFNLYDADRSEKLSMTEIKEAICAGKNLDERVWMSGVYSNFNAKAMDANNASTSGSFMTMTMGT